MSGITKDMRIDEILSRKPEAAEIFMNVGMYCFGCPAAQIETLADVADLYEFDPDDLVEQINQLPDE